MIEREYAYRLVVKGKTVYEDKIARQNPREALSWGFYWMPGDWTAGDEDIDVHAEIAIVRNNGDLAPWKSYWTNYTRDVSYIRHWTDEDVRCLIAGQTLIWKIVNKEGLIACDRLFRSYKDADRYMSDNGLWMNCYAVHVWVDGWYAEEYSWKGQPVKGYENLRSLDEDIE